MEARTPNEQWRNVLGWEGLYEVSDQGQVRSVDRNITYRTGGTRLHRGRIRVARTTTDGHRQVWLKRAGHAKNRLVHILVLEAFVGPRPEGAISRHLNGDPADNRLENLAWGTFSENNLDQVAHGTHACARKTHCPQGHPYAGSNLRVTKTGGRSCRECNNASARRYQQRKRHAVSA